MKDNGCISLKRIAGLTNGGVCVEWLRLVYSC